MGDVKLSYAHIKQGCNNNNNNNKDVTPDVDTALHMAISVFLEAESKVLAETAELVDPDGLTSHKSGLEL